MSDLFPNRIGVMKSEKDDEGEDKCMTAIKKKRQVTSIMEWVQCFGIYTAVLAEKYPQKVKDLLGYQTLIVEAHMEYEGGTWMGYVTMSVAGDASMRRQLGPH